MKKIKLSILLFVFALIAVSCSNDDKESSSGDLKLSGTVMAPNNLFPISKATVKVFKGNEMIAQKVTDAIGAFEINNLPEGQLTVELSKGKFKREVLVEMTADYVLGSTERNLDIFPKIVVVTGYYDEIESILVNIGLVNDAGEPAFAIIDGNPSGRHSGNHSHGNHDAAQRMSLPSNVSFTLEDMLHDPTLLSTYDILFLNCGGEESLTNDPIAMANLEAFIENGGIVYATDWMYKFLQTMFPAGEYLSFATPERAGSSDTAEVQIMNADLVDWLEAQGIEANPTMTINGFLGGWQMVDTFTTNVNSWMIAQTVDYGGMNYTDKGLAFTYQHGEGGVFYSSFHTHGNDPSEEAIAQMMNYFVFELSGL